MSDDVTVPQVTLLEIVDHLNELVFLVTAQNRDLLRKLAERDRRIELLLAVDRSRPRKEPR